MKILAIATLTGIAAGLLGALCGVGGGIVMVPAYVTALGFEQKKAVATSLAVIVIVALVSTLNTSLRKGESLIDWRVVALTAVAAALEPLVRGRIFDFVPHKKRLAGKAGKALFSLTYEIFQHQNAGIPDRLISEKIPIKRTPATY